MVLIENVQPRREVMSDLKVCGVCCGDISDRYIMRVADTSYHERCLICAICGIRLAHTCFSKDSKLLCRLDYDRLYAKKCLGCSERISADELVMRALDNIFHLRCFICVVCGGHLQRGDQFIIKQGQLFCRPDYEKEVEMLQGYAPGDYCNEDLAPSRAHDGRRGPKRPRTILTTQQRRAFKASFELSAKPCRKVRENLAKDTGLSVRIVQGPKRQHTMLTTQQREAFKQYFNICPKPGCKVREGLARDTGLSARIVQVWFQNQRAKMKKMQKKARQDTKSKDVDSGDEKKLVIKEEDSPGPVIFANDDTGPDHMHSSESFSYDSHNHSDLSNIKSETPDTVEGMYKIVGSHYQTNHMHRHFHDRPSRMPHPHHFISELGYDVDENLPWAWGGQDPIREFTPAIKRENEPKMDAGFGDFSYVPQPLYPNGLPHYYPHNMSAPDPNPIDGLYSMQNTYFCGDETPTHQ